MKILLWSPRFLAILFNGFLGIFALDVFSEPQWILALFMHLIPNFVLAILTIIAWKYQKIGGFLFLIAGFIMTIFFHSIWIALPAFVIGILFLISGFFNIRH